VPDFRIPPRDRVVVVGRTQSGKSTLARALTAGYQSQVVIDPKHREELARSHTVYDVAGFVQLYPHRARRIVYRPDPEARTPDDVDQVIRRILAYGQTAIVVHEAMLYASPAWILPAYKRAIVTGAELGIPVWSCTQRPTGVHNVVLSEAEHVFLFDLHLPSDREKMAGIVGVNALEVPNRPFAFGYYGPTTAGVLVRCSPLELPHAATHPREPGDRHDHGDGRDLPHEGDHPDGQHSGPLRPRERDLTRSSRAPAPRVRPR
jgi:energy-coupling factor transporter ATP-binding protein EcfA2